MKTEVDIYRYSHSDIFDTASTYLSTVISQNFQATQPSHGKYERRRQVKSAGVVGRGVRGGRFEGKKTGVGVVKEAAEDEAKEIEIKVKMELT